MRIVSRIRSLAHRFGFVTLSSSIIVWGFVRGSHWLTLHVEFAFVLLVVGVLQAVVSTAVFAGFLTVSGFLYLLSVARARRGDGVPPGRAVTAIVPVYRDSAVLDRSVTSLLNSDHDAVEVLVVCEPDDEASIRRAKTLAGHDRVDYLINDAYTGTKAGAINYALEQVDTEAVGVFDADEVVHPSFVGSALARLEDCDVVQGRTVPETTGVLEALAYCESVVLSYVGRRLLYLVTDFRMAASRAIVADRATLVSAGGYDPAMVTEDFEFAYRCYKRRLDVREHLGYPSRIEAAHSVGDWWGQRKRWMTGYVQVLRRLAVDAVPPDDARDLLSLAICTSTVAGSALCLSIVSKFAVLLLWGANWLVLVPVVALLSVTLAVRVTDAWLGVVDDIGWQWALVVFVFPLYSLAALNAIVASLTTGTDEWYHVAKGADAADGSLLR